MGVFDTLNSSKGVIRREPTLMFFNSPSQEILPIR